MGNLIEWVGDHTVVGPGSKTAEWIDDQTFLPGDLVSSLLPVAVAMFIPGVREATISALTATGEAIGAATAKVGSWLGFGGTTAIEPALLESMLASGELSQEAAALLGATSGMDAATLAAAGVGKAMGAAATETITTGGGTLGSLLSAAGKALSSGGGWTNLLGTALSAGTSLYLGAKGAEVAGEAADIQAMAAQRAIDADLEKFYAAMDITKPFADIQLDAMKQAQIAITAGAPERVPYEGGELENFLLERGRREAQRLQSLRGGPSGRGVEEAVGRGQVAAIAGREMHEREQQNILNRYLQAEVNPLLALSGGGQVALQQAGATERAGVRQAGGIRDIGDIRAGGRISGFNVFAPTVAGAGEEFYNYLLDR